MSLRARILLLALAASLLPLLTMLWLLLEIRASNSDQTREQIIQRSETIAAELDDRIAGTGQLLFGLGRVPLVGSDDQATCSAFLADVLKEHPQYTGILTIRPNGNLHCDSLNSGRALNLNDRQYFRQARTASGTVVEAAVGRLTGKGVLQIAYPVRAADNTLRYVLLASLDMDTYGRAVAAALPFARMNFQVWNGDGSIVMDHPGPGSTKLEVGPAEKTFMLGPSPDNTAVVGADESARIWVKALLPGSRDTGLRLALSVPEADLNERVDSQFRQALSWLAMAAALIFVVAAVLGEFAVRRQTARLMQAISRMDAGDYRSRIGAPYPRGELGQVMGALDRMAGSLEQQRVEIARNTEALEYQANTDPLTHLANRHLLTDRLEQTLVYARRAHRVAGVLMLDLDRFKTVNDSLGHRQGDQLRRAVADRLRACVREGDTVARLGGDEFVVVLSDMADVADIVPVAQKILGALAEPMEIGRQLLSVNTSLGIAVYPRDGETADTLLQYADTAMYRAKADGGNAMAFFTPEMMRALTERLQLEAGLRRAIELGELRVHFQPIIDAGSGRVVSAEALVRWQDPERGLVSPLEFIPIAEETGLIVPLGDWVLREACTQARAWQDLGLGSISVAVNLSVRQFAAPTLDESVARALEASGCPASLLHLEITESSIMDQIEQAMTTMYRLIALGLHLTIDDFGTGYSSLSQLKRLPVTTLKIDRAFVRDIQREVEDDVFVDAILTLARKLGLRTVAEGVETEEQLGFLASRGCDAYQGFLFSRPLAAEAMPRFLRERNT